MQKVLTLILFISFFTVNISAQPVPLWEKGKIPNHQKSKGKAFIPKRDIIFITNVQAPTIEVLLPSKQSANGMAVLICPGGGYGGVSYDWEGTDVAKWLNGRGIAAFVLKYRMPQAESVITSHKAPLQDAQRAMRYIRHYAEKFNIDKNKVGVMGFSAGGHLASALGTHFERAYYKSKDDMDNEMIRPDFMMLIYPVISMQKVITHYGSRKHLLGENPSDELVTEFSSELQVCEKTPPTFILHSGDDKAVPVENSIRMYQALVKHKVSATMHIYPTGGHGYGLGKSRIAAPDWTKLAEEWLEKQTMR
ncbi:MULTISPECIES: alpha/beta hydrolase [unclassified Saccharicrinis]|uniref:alpha/beta hydrolase n=1 Tax=unclassified Saccharicrinis TaxID=2646859 RepID=UPI003D33FC10